jgi:hypothetical protein
MTATSTSAFLAMKVTTSSISQACTPFMRIHEAEQQYIANHGLKAFWDLDWDP